MHKVENILGSQPSIFLFYNSVKYRIKGIVKEVEEKVVIVVILIFAGGIILSTFYSKRNREKSYLRDVRKSYGKLVKIKYNDMDIGLTKGYFDFIKENLEFYLDDITFGDFNLEEIYRSIANNGSSIGDEVLYKLLREQTSDIKELKRRDSIIEYFRRDEKRRDKIRLFLKKVGKSETCKMYKYTLDEERFNYKLLWVLGKLPIIFAALILVYPIAFIFMVIAIVINSVIALKTFSMNNTKIVDYEYIIKIIKAGHFIKSLNIEELNSWYPNISKTLGKLNRVKKQAFINADNSIPEAVGMNEFFRIFFLSEAIQIEKIGKELRDNQGELLEIYKFVGEIESFISIASLRDSMDMISTPVINKSSEIKMKDAYYPLIKEPVKNSIDIDNPILLTGSNASGKSTFLRSVGINIIFAQSFYMVFADKYEGGFFKVYSSMALKDNLLGEESYYIVESKSLKRILDARKGNENIICFIDEILRGTNTIERIAASSEILKHLSTNGYKVIAATHDIELTDILKKYFNNYHFSEKILDDEIVFDYKLYRGKTTTRNAIKILDILGYEKEVVESAENRAKDFMVENKWREI